MEGPVKKMMVYIDGTEQSITAAQYAICLSRAIGAELIALYVVNTRELARQKGLAIETISTSGTVQVVIKNKIREHGIDLLVIGELSHVRSRRDEFYNEAERAMRNVPCSVLIVKDEDRVWELFESLR